LDLNSSLELLRRHRCRPGGGLLFTAELGQISNWLSFAVHDNVAAGRVIMLDMEATVIDSHKRNELVVIVFDEKNVAVAHFEFRRVAYFHGLIADCAAKHPDRVGIAGVAFHIVVHFEGNIGLNVALTALAFPD